MSILPSSPDANIGDGPQFVRLRRPSRPSAPGRSRPIFLNGVSFAEVAQLAATLARQHGEASPVDMLPIAILWLSRAAVYRDQRYLTDVDVSAAELVSLHLELGGTLEEPYDEVNLFWNAYKLAREAKKHLMAARDKFDEKADPSLITDPISMREASEAAAEIGILDQENARKVRAKLQKWHDLDKKVGAMLKTEKWPVDSSGSRRALTFREVMKLWFPKDRWDRRESLMMNFLGFLSGLKQREDGSLHSEVDIDKTAELRARLREAGMSADQVFKYTPLIHVLRAKWRQWVNAQNARMARGKPKKRKKGK